MSRTYVVTGSASGIGEATTRLLRERGATVIGVDLHDAEVTADLTTQQGRAAMIDEVTRLSGGGIDAIIANAGVSWSIPDTIALNYYGAVATLDGLRPLLAGSAHPRAVAVSSMTSLEAYDERLLGLLLDGTEAQGMDRATAIADRADSYLYATSKRALAKWIRRNAASKQWAGAGIPLNAIAPGLVRTPMLEKLFENPAQQRMLERMTPMPLGGVFEPEDAAKLLTWLAGEENAHLCGQVVFIDGGSDVVIRGDSTW